MAHDEVNLRLYCCRLQLDQYQHYIDEQTLPLQVIEHLAGEAALYHLRACYQSYLKELAATYQLPINESLDSVLPLVSLMSAQGHVAAELNQLLQLERQQGSWLALLAEVPSLVASVVKVGPQRSEIRLNQASGTKLALSGLISTYSQLKQLIESQRNLTQEW